MVRILVRKIVLIFAGFLGAVVMAIGIFVIGIYQFGWNGILTSAFVKIFPLPAAVVGGHMVEMADVEQTLVIYRQVTGLNISTRDVSVTRKDIVAKLVQESVVHGLAEKYAIQPSSEEVQNYYEYLIAGFGLDSNLASQEIQKKLGVSESAFQDQFVVPELEKAKLAVYLMQSAENQSNPAYQKAGAVLELLRGGTEFSQAARDHSENSENKFIGGDLGFQPLDRFDPWMQVAVKNLKIGEVSGIVITPTGYHILKLAGKDSSDGVEKYHVNDILIKGPDIDKFLETQIAGLRVYIFDKI